MPLFFQMKRLLGRPGAEGAAEPGVHSTARFSEIIRNERARCDRYGRFFSLVMFHVDDRRYPTPLMRKWIRRLRRRIRPIDAMGWIDRNRLAVLLPSTPPSGAETFIASLQCQPPPFDAVPAWNVFLYPCTPREQFETEANETRPADEQTIERT